MNNKYLYPCLIGIFVLIYIAPLDHLPLFIPDETRYAEIPREMIATGDWVVPRLNGLNYFEKPVMGYWISSLSLMTIGENNFAVRLPSALACGFIALMIMLLCNYSCGRRSQVAGLATVVFLTSLGVVTIGGIAVLDGILTFFVSACLICFFMACEQQVRSKKEHQYLFLAGLLAGCAFLTKGFLAFAVPVLTVAPYFLWQKRWRDCFRMVWLPLFGAALISLPWALLIHLREPDFWSYFFWHEHIHRFFAESAQHKEAFWFFIAALPLMFIPWTFILPTAYLGLRNKIWQSQSEFNLFKFCICWFIFPFLFFSASSGKLLTYILPCFPPLAILSGLGFTEYLKSNSTKTFQIGAGIAAVIFGITMIALPGIQLLGFVEAPPFYMAWKWIAITGSLGIMVLLLIISIRYEVGLKKYIVFALSPVCLFITAHLTMPQQTLERKALEPLLQQYVKKVNPQTVILSSEDVVRAVCWYFKRDNVFLIESAGELHYGLNQEDSRSHISPEEASELIRKHPGNAILVTDRDQYNRWHQFLPKPLIIDTLGTRGYLLLRY